MPSWEGDCLQNAVIRVAGRRVSGFKTVPDSLLMEETKQCTISLKTPHSVSIYLKHNVAENHLVYELTEIDSKPNNCARCAQNALAR